MFSNLFPKTLHALPEVERIAYQLSMAIDAHAAITIADANGSIKYANNKFLAASGYSADEVVGKSHCLLNTDYYDEAFIQAMYARLAQGHVYQDLFLNRTKTGETLWLDTTLIALQDDSGQVYRYIAIRRDVTPLVSANEQLQRALTERDTAQAQLLHANKIESIGQLTAGIAHDFNNLLAIVLGYTNLLQQSLPANLPPDIGEYLSTIETASLRGRDLVAKLMTYCRRDTATHHQLTAVAPAPIIDETLHMLRPALASTVNIITHLDAAQHDSRYHVALRPGDLQQIITNLVINARDAIDQHGTITLAIEQVTWLDSAHCSDCHQPLHRADNNSWVAISVADSGCGMDAAQLLRIFDPFYTTKPINQGTGLGLSVISGIVHEAGGHCHVRSTVGEGSVFTLLLPPCELPAALNTPAPQPAHVASAGRRLLIVDDEPMVLGLLETKLKQSGHAITALSDPHQALSRISANPSDFDLVITDYQMPSLDGLTLAHTLREQNPTLPLIICSGSPISPDRLPSNTRKFDKPLDFKALLAYIAAH